MSGEEGPARGAPAPFSQEQVDALVRGAPEAEATAVLSRRPHQQFDPPPSDPPPAAQRGAPLEVSAAWLEQLARGETPEELAGLLEDQVRAAQADPPLEEPTTPTDRPREIPPSEKSASGDR